MGKIKWINDDEKYKVETDFFNTPQPEKPAPKTVSKYVIKRLPRYYRFLCELLNEGKTKISSKELSERMRLNASQIRQDLNCYGGFGQQGYGYDTETLRNEIAKIIGIEKTASVIIIGTGNMAKIIASDVNFEKLGCKLTGIFNIKNNPEKNKRKIAGFDVYERAQLPEFCENNKPQIAALCIPMNEAEEICGELIESGVKSFWNFSHYDINLHYDGVNVENLHFGDSLLTLVYKVNNM